MLCGHECAFLPISELVFFYLKLLELVLDDYSLLFFKSLNLALLDYHPLLGVTLIVLWEFSPRTFLCYGLWLG